MRFALIRKICLAWAPFYVSDMSGEIHLSMSQDVAARGFGAVVEDLMEETEDNVELWAILTKRSMCRRFGLSTEGVTVCWYEMANFLEMLDSVRMREPLPWKDPRKWWPECPLSHPYLFTVDCLLPRAG